METTDSGSSFEISTSTQLDFENIFSVAVCRI